MRSLASLILRGRFQAGLVIALASPLPLLSILGGAALALVTLRMGAREGILVGFTAAGIAGGLFFLLFGSLAPLVGLSISLWLPLWLLSALLRYTVSWAKTLQLGMGLTALGILGYAVYLGDSTAWGRSLLEVLLKPLLQQVGIVSDGAEALGQVLDYLAPFVLGLMFANSLGAWLASLLLGRWWQALLFNPGGFRKEFHDLRLGRQTALVAVAVWGAALVSGSPLLVNLALPVLLIYALQGIAVVHGAVAKAGLAGGWLALMYALLLLMLPQLLILLCLLGISDAWLDIRARLKPPAGTL